MAKEDEQQDGTEEMKQAGAKKSDLIQSAMIDGRITPEYAALLALIHSSTTSGSIANLRKVEACLALRDELQSGFDQGRVAYIGSGTDWEFPVALGARRIDMVDPALSEENVKEMLFAGLGPHEIEEADQTSVTFGIDLGSGQEQVELRLFPVDATVYKPRALLSGVIEFAGPTKDLAPESPVLPRLANILRHDGVVLNFDFQENRVHRFPTRKLLPHKVDGFVVFKQ